MGRASLMHAPKPWKRSRLLANHFDCVAVSYLRMDSSKRTGREKRPYYIQSRDEEPVMFAGVWDTWRNRGELITSCAIITTAANELVAELHDRMPTILSLEFQDVWLSAKTTRNDLLRMLVPFPASEMKMYPVSATVNSPENDRVDLLAKVDPEIGQTLSLF